MTEPREADAIQIRLRARHSAALSGPELGLAQRLGYQLAVGLDAQRMDRSFCCRGRDRAARLAQMPAVVELALADVRAELDESMLDVLRRQMVQAEFLQARRVDDMACRIE